MSPFISNSGKVNASLASCFMADILLLTATVFVVRPHPSCFMVMVIPNQVGHFENVTKAEERRGREGGKPPRRERRGGIHYLGAALPLAAP